MIEERTANALTAAMKKTKDIIADSLKIYFPVFKQPLLIVIVFNRIISIAVHTDIFENFSRKEERKKKKKRRVVHISSSSVRLMC